eukprot:scaffold1339_cov148-Isochrysis_galbana.AAC.1
MVGWVPPRATVAFSRAESATPNQVVSPSVEFENLPDSPVSPTSVGEAGLIPPASPVAVKPSPGSTSKRLTRPTRRRERRHGRRRRAKSARSGSGSASGQRRKVRRLSA